MIVAWWWLGKKVLLFGSWKTRWSNYDTKEVKNRMVKKVGRLRVPLEHVQKKKLRREHVQRKERTAPTRTKAKKERRETRNTAERDYVEVQTGKKGRNTKGGNVGKLSAVSQCLFKSTLPFHKSACSCTVKKNIQGMHAYAHCMT